MPSPTHSCDSVALVGLAPFASLAAQLTNKSPSTVAGGLRKETRPRS